VLLFFFAKKKRAKTLSAPNAEKMRVQEKYKPFSFLHKKKQTFFHFPEKNFKNPLPFLNLSIIIEIKVV